MSLNKSRVEYFIWGKTKSADVLFCTLFFLYFLRKYPPILLSGNYPRDLGEIRGKDFRWY